MQQPDHNTISTDKIGTDNGEMILEKPQKKSKLRKRIGLALFIALNAAVLIYTALLDFTKERPKTKIAPFGMSNILFLLGALGCVALVLGAETVKYLLMMRHLGERVSVRTAFETAALGKYYDCITPSGAGGQPFQIWHLHSHGYSSGASSAMPLSGFITMQFGFVFLCLVVFIFNNNAIDNLAIKITAYVGAFTYTLAPVMIILAAVAPKLSMRITAFFINLGAKIRIVKNPRASIKRSVRALSNYSHSLKKIGKHKGMIVMLMLLSILFQVSLCSLPYFVIHIFGGDLDYFKALSMCVFIYAAICLIPTPGNSGAAEGSFYLLFSELNTADLFWAMVVWRLLCYYSFIAIGLLVYGWGAIEKLFRKNQKKESEHESQ